MSVIINLLNPGKDKGCKSYRIHKMSNGKAFNAVKVAKSGYLVLALTKNGKIYHWGGPTTSASYSPGDYKWDGDMCECLHKLGLVDQEVVDYHRKIVKKRSEMRSKRYAIDSIKDEYKELGLNIPKRELEKLEKLRAYCVKNRYGVE